MKRSNESTSDYNITYMTPRIADIVADVQREKGLGRELVGIEDVLPQS